jgi:hypothetical protein
MSEKEFDLNEEKLEVLVTLDDPEYGPEEDHFHDRNTDGTVTNPNQGLATKV